MFVQLNGWSWDEVRGGGAVPAGGRQTLSGVRLPTRSGLRANGLTLMRMVTVGFLTVVIGHVG